MKELISETFDQGRLPDAWFTDSLCCSFEKNGMRSGSNTQVQILLSGYGWRTLRVEIELDSEDGKNVACELDHVACLVVDLKEKYARHSAFKYSLELEKGNLPITAVGKTHSIVFEFNDIGSMKAQVNGIEVVSAIDPSPIPAGKRLCLGFVNDCLVRSVRVYGDGQLEKPPYEIPPKSQDNYFLEVSVDFYDDLLWAPYTHNSFDELFAELKSWGTRRVQWIYYGKKEDGWWDYAPLGVGPHAMQTFDNVGDIFKAAVDAAHNHGIEIYGLIKPFDMGLHCSYGEGTPEAFSQGRIQMVGGKVGWIAKFPAERRELVMSRKPGVYGDAENEVFNRIDLVKEDDAQCAFSVDDVEILVSEDNVTYIPYGKPITRLEIVEDYPLYVHTASGGRLSGKSVSSRVFRFSELEIRSKYFALAVDSREGSFRNDPLNLIHVFGEKGEECRLTYGYNVRRGPDIKPLPFRNAGVEFDTNPNAPTALCGGGYDAIRASHIFDSEPGFYAVGRGKDKGPLAALSPSFSETRQWWLTWVKDILEAGADGVELRVSNHHAVLAWGEYGFETPVVEAFKNRYGVDLLATDDFDRAAFRKIRGEAYTQFYREVSELVKSYGKRLGMHITNTMNTDPVQGARMEIQFDWQTWLREGLADSVTMKDSWPGTRFAEELMSLTRPQGILAVFCPYANNYWSQPPYSSVPPGGAKVVDDLITAGREGGCDGYQFYECASVLQPTEDGHVVMRQPSLREVFKKHFG